ncbi:hypothetical protein DC498_09730 [Terrimonas sp.]|uniref:hypothetical protein n=1 Tax=Terrimonas sp. TaxID=1914338 RepID=UPI000D5086CA|nr:hypothetical protein [Terrimonas sp.]PVD52383.1 hypothetical protein DC498_09730 [Terrimonas sp.]
MNYLRIPNKKGDKIIFHHDFGRGKGQRPSTGIFIYKRPKDFIQKNHNKEALALLEVVLTTRIIQKKTDQPVTLTLHPIAQSVLKRRKDILTYKLNYDDGDLVFNLPSQDMF